MGLAYSPETDWLRPIRPNEEPTPGEEGVLKAKSPVIVKVDRGNPPPRTVQPTSVDHVATAVREQEVHLMADVVARALNGATSNILGRFAQEHGDAPRGIIVQALNSDAGLADAFIKTEVAHPDILEELPEWPALKDRLKVAIAALPNKSTQD